MMRRAQYQWWAIMVVALMAMHPSHLWAQTLRAGPTQCPDWGSISVNEVYQYNPTPILSCILSQAADPPREWLCRGSGFCSAPTARIYARLHQPIVPAHRPQTKYVDEGCPYYEPTGAHTGTAAGGAYDGGATDACELGEGSGVSPNVVVETRVPEVGNRQVDCLSNLFGGLSNALSGNNRGNVNIGGSAASGSFNASGVRGRGNASVGSRGACAQGNIGICGMSLLRGNVCVGSQAARQVRGARALSAPFSRLNPPSYVPVSGIVGFDYPPNNINVPSTGVWTHQGGVVTVEDPSYGSLVYEVPQDGFVTYDDQGRLHIGSAQGTPPAGESNVRTPFNGGLPLSEDAMVTIHPIGGTATVDGALFAGNTVGQPSASLEVSTVRAAHEQPGDVGEVQLNRVPNAGPTLAPNFPPEEVGGVAGGEHTGAFPADPTARATTNFANPTLNADADAALQSN